MVLRDTLLRAAAAGFFQLRWTAQILEEMTRSLERHPKRPMPTDKAARLRAAMEKAFDDADVTDYARYIPVMQNEPDDRHVAAAAVAASAQVIVTFNLKHFSPLPNGIEARAPDDFLCVLFEQNPAAFLAVMRVQAAEFKEPPLNTLDGLLLSLQTIAPQLVQAVRAWAASGQTASSPAQP